MREEFVIRKDDNPEIIHSDLTDYLDVESILKKDYEYIYESIQNEGHILENNLGDMFKEILYESKVVGFALYELNSMTSLTLNEIYILPEFRGKGLFLVEIITMFEIGNTISILQPTKKLVEILIHYELAYKLTENIVASAISFDLKNEDILSNSDEKFDNEQILSGNLYDLNIRSSLFLMDISTPGKNIIFYHKELKNDLNEYGKRATLNESYFNEIKTLFLENHEEFTLKMFDLKEKLPESQFGFDIVVGYDDEFTDYMQSMIDEGLISKNKAQEIKDILTDEYLEDEVTDDGILTRLNFFINDMDSLIKPFNFLDTDVSLCPYCHNPINLTDKTCQICGYNLRYEDDYFEDDDFEDNLTLDTDNILSQISELLEKLKNSYKLEDIEYGEEHIRNYDLNLYRLLEFINEVNNLDLAFMVLNDLKTHQDKYEGLLFKKRYVTYEITKETWFDYANKNLTIPDLKKILKDNGLKVSGRKQELIDRISENDIFLNEFNSDKLFLTKKGKDYLNKNSWIELYEGFLNDFDFDDFCRFYRSNEGNSHEIISKYLDEHLKLAKKDKDFDYMISCFSSKSILSELDENINDVLKWEMRKFSLIINPIYIEEKYSEFYIPLNKEYVDKIRLLKEEFSTESIMDSFEESWDYFKFNKFIISKEEAKDLLEELLNNEDNSKLINSYIERYQKGVIDNTLQTNLNDYFNS